MAVLVPAGVTLRAQVDARWPARDRGADGWIGDAAHAARASDHNPDAHGWVHAIDVDKDGIDADAFADQLLTYARTRAPGSGRLANIVYRGRVASGTYPNTFWTWRPDASLGHFDHVHVSFTAAAETDGRPFPLPILEDDMPLTPADLTAITHAVWSTPPSGKSGAPTAWGVITGAKPTPAPPAGAPVSLSQVDVDRIAAAVADVLAARMDG
jgi:hypothetical protein